MIMIMKVLELYRKSQHFHETIRLVYNTVLNFTIFFFKWFIRFRSALNRERLKKDAAAVSCVSSNLSATCLDCDRHLKLKHVVHVSPLQSTPCHRPMLHSTDSNP